MKQSSGLFHSDISSDTTEDEITTSRLKADLNCNQRVNYPIRSHLYAI